MTNTQLSKALFGLCRRHIAVNYQETKLIEEAARRLQDLGEKERPDPVGQSIVEEEENEKNNDICGQ